MRGRVAPAGSLCPGVLMITEEKIKRINELARKSKTAEGLTEEERLEQQLLRQEYISAFRDNLRAQFENIEFVDEDGSRHKPKVH